MNNQDLRKRVNFEMIRYANCWEDAAILLQGLSPKIGSKILSIASAGDNSFSLLASDPELVVAVDINKVQLYLTELKKICISKLEHEETLKFLGFLPSTDREKCFNSLKSELSMEAKMYWESNISLIRSGVIHEGKFEKYFQLFSKKILPWIHSQKTTEALLSKKSEQEQQEFYDKKWNTWRWRLLFRLFFSNYVMGKYGRDPEFLKQVKGSVSKYIFNKAAVQLQSKSAQENFILRYTLTGNFGTLLPHYLLEENYEKVRSNIHKLQLREGFAQDAISEFGKFDCMNLSDIFEYMDDKLFYDTSEMLLEGMKNGGKLAYWNLMVPRKISEIFPQKATHCTALSESLTKIDKGFFYKEFIVDQIRN